jgi:hypothetical protein
MFHEPNHICAYVVLDNWSHSNIIGNPYRFDLLVLLSVAPQSV